MSLNEELEKVLRKVLALTAAEKLEWEPIDRSRVRTALGPFTILAADEFFEIYDSGDNLLGRIDWSDLEFSAIIGELYRTARASALEVREKLAELDKLLDDKSDDLPF
jgi:hypothetical protein